MELQLLCVPVKWVKNFNFWKAQYLVEPNNNHKPESRILVLFCHLLTDDQLLAGMYIICVLGRQHQEFSSGNNCFPKLDATL